MPLRRVPCALRACSLGSLLGLAALAAGCGIIPASGTPALNYAYGSGEPLRLAVFDATGGDDWTPAIDASVWVYATSDPHLWFRSSIESANIVITFRRYGDATPPELQGYAFPSGAGGFAAVYDAAGIACNFPPSPLPLACSGEIARADIYLNDIIPGGSDVETRRERLILHEIGHALGLTRHSPDLDTPDLAARYGWDQ